MVFGRRVVGEADLDLVGFLGEVAGAAGRGSGGWGGVGLGGPLAEGVFDGRSEGGPVEHAGDAEDGGPVGVKRLR